MALVDFKRLNDGVSVTLTANTDSNGILNGVKYTVTVKTNEDQGTIMLDSKLMLVAAHRRDSSSRELEQISSSEFYQKYAPYLLEALSVLYKTKLEQLHTDIATRPAHADTPRILHEHLHTNLKPYVLENQLRNIHERMSDRVRNGRDLLDRISNN